MKRLFDILISLILIFLFSPIIILVWLYIRIVSPGEVFYNSKRVGINNQIFLMPKFRSMKMGTPQLATHLLKKSEQYLIPGGSLIRKLSLDELPQLWSVIKGDMSLVGPRPALFNQDDLIKQRTDCGVEKIKPGITGWAQINGRNNLSWNEKFKMDIYYIENISLVLDLKILTLTFIKILKSEGVNQSKEIPMIPFNGNN